ncbi:MAG: spermidine/putrescine ABC transporter substrate-binding protein [Chloroflexota bacterium]|nr:spermidine/putrescine ABC transporter substrate-binding protein [Chloroflexota bacterium]
MPDDQDGIERAIERALSQGRYSRRGFLRRAGTGALVAGSALSLPAILAACGIKPGASAGASSTLVPLPSAPAGQLNWANWPAYIDIDEDTKKYPTIEKFTDETGIKVTYTEAVNDNEEFFGKIQPDLAKGSPTGYDVIVVTDWLVERLIRLGYLEPLDKPRIPNFDANVQPIFKDPWYDPGNKYSTAWVSGITGIGYNPKLTGRKITTFDDLLDPKFAGKVGMFSEMRDTMSLALLSLGVKPENATIADVEKARDKLLAPARAGQFRNFYGNEYYDELANGNLSLTIAWSGDVSQMKLYDNPDVEFIIPETGGVLFVDNMCIPNKAEHPLDAHLLMNFWYDPANSTPLTEYVGYFSPVKGVAEAVRKDAAAAAAAGDQASADALKVVADTSYPTEEALKNVFNYKVLKEDEELTWNKAFNEVVTG